MDLRELLLAARLAMPRHSAAALCRELGVTRTTYYRWEKWEETQAYPNDDHALKLAEIAGVSLDKAVFAVYAARAKNPLVSKMFSGYSNAA